MHGTNSRKNGAENRIRTDDLRITNASVFFLQKGYLGYWWHRHIPIELQLGVYKPNL